MKDVFFSKDLMKLSGLNEEELKALLLSEEGEVKENATEIYAKTVLDKFKAESREQFNRGVREKANAVEKAATELFSTFGIQSEKVEEGLKQLATELQGRVQKSDPTNLKPDDIRKLPAFQSVLDETVSKINQELNTIRSEYDSYKTNVVRERTMSVVQSKVREVLEKSNAAFSENPSTQLGFFIKAIDTTPFQVDTTGNVVITNSDGTPLRDDYGNKMDFHDYVVNQWKAAGYGFKQAPDPVPNPPGKDGKQNKNYSSLQSAQEALQSARNPEERAKILKEMAALSRKA
jgi:hypothetical protein